VNSESIPVLRIIFQGFNFQKRCFGDCVLVILETLFDVKHVYDISVQNQYPVCSELRIDRLIEEKCLNAENGFSEFYLRAKKEGFAFMSFPERANNGLDAYRVPRISEADFEKVIVQLGGRKNPVSSVKTPDFVCFNIGLELKDLQKESLNNKERQDSIGRVFNSSPMRTVNLNPIVDYGQPSIEYRRLISNNIKRQIKKASSQLKEFAKTSPMESAGIIFLNTGMFSLPHDNFKIIVSDILARETKFIKFAFVFSQIMQTNGWEMYAVFQPDFIGIVPDPVRQIADKLRELVDDKMTEMMRSNPEISAVDSLTPISFYNSGKIFYWNPGRLKYPWEEQE
jgi:hypothetical protein